MSGSGPVPGPLRQPRFDSSAAAPDAYPTFLLRYAAVAIAGVYFVVAAIWVLLSDLVVQVLFRDPALTAEVQTAKGWLFVAVTALVLYALVAWFVRQLAAARTQTATADHDLSQVLDAIPDPVSLLDPAGVVRTRNRAAETRFERTGAPGGSAFEAVAEDDRDAAKAAFAKVAAGETQERVLHVLLADRVMPFRFRAAPMRRDDGTVAGIVVTARDLSAELAVAERVRTSLAGREGHLASIVEAVARLSELRDPYTYGHQLRTVRIAGAMAEHMGLDRDRIEGLRLAAIIHDIGKVAVPAEILTKPTRLTPEEMAIIKRHPGVAYELFKSVALPWPLADIVHQHHEKLDGSGYPLGLRGDAILVESRILCVADTVEAMATPRPYRKALGLDTALAELERGKGSLYDPNAVAACAAVVDRFDWT